MNRIGKKQLLTVAVATFVAMLLMVPATGWAQSKPWAKLADGVLTFTYGAKPATESANIKCPNCGKPIAAAHKFCPNCGTAKPKPKSFVFAVPLNAKNVEDLPWRENQEEVKQVVFNQSFRQVSNITSTANWFCYMGNLTSITGLENLRTGNVTNMERMFSGCLRLTSLNLSIFNTSNVTDMNTMFHSCKSLTSLNLSNFDTSKVTDMNYMFSICERLTSLNLSSFNTSNVTKMYTMFFSCKSLTSLDLSNFDTRNVTDMYNMFALCPSLKTITVSSTTWDSQKADTKDMFEKCPAQIVKK